MSCERRALTGTWRSSLVTQMDIFRRLLGTTKLNLREFGWALVPPIALLVLWEIGKLIARRSASAGRLPEAGGLPLAEVPATKGKANQRGSHR